MRVPRIYIDTTLQLNTTLTLDERATHYVLHVLRAKPHSLIIIFNGDGIDYHATIQSVAKNKVLVRIEKQEPIHNESPLNIHLGQVIARGEKMDFVIQKAVELGVKQLTPLYSERCGVNLLGARLVNKMQHWQNVIISATEQCRRNTLLKLHSPTQCVTWLGAQKECCVMLDLNSQKTMADIKKTPESISLLIGPEGGFSSDEIQKAKEMKNNIEMITLGPRVLRTETAALVAVSVMQYRWGDYSSCYL